MNINQLHDLCFVHIFGHFTPTELYRLSSVCKQWKFLVGFCVYNLKLEIILTTAVENNHVANYTTDQGELFEAANPIVTLRKTNFETIFKEHLINRDGTPVHSDTSQRDTIKLTSYSLSSIARLVETFPRINNLDVFVRCEPEQAYAFEVLIALVEAYYANLTSLKLCICYRHSGHVNLEDCAYEFYIDRSQSTRLLATINRMLNLQHLTLEINCRWFKHEKQLVLPIIRRLREFNFASFDKTFVLHYSLLRYASPNENLLKIGYCYGDTRFHREELRYNLTPQLCAKFHVLSYTNCLGYAFPNLLPCGTNQEVRQSDGQFTSLTTLTVDLDENRVSLYNIFARLAQLRQLTVLNVKCKHFKKQKQPSGRPFPQLGSVKVLTVDLIRFPSYLSPLKVAWTFPNVQVLNLRVACWICIQDSVYYLTVKDCQHLRALFFNRRKVSIERLLLHGRREADAQNRRKAQHGV